MVNDQKVLKNSQQYNSEKVTNEHDKEIPKERQKITNNLDIKTLEL